MVNLLYRFTIYILEKIFDNLTITIYLHLALTQSRFVILKCYFARQCTGNLTVNKSGPKRRSECLQMSLQLLIHPSLLAKSKTKFQRWLGFTDPPKEFFCREPGEEYWNSQRPCECWATELMFQVWQCPRSPSFYFPPSAYCLLFSLSLLCQVSPCVISPPNKFPQAEAPPLHPFLQSQTPFILMRRYDWTYTFMETFEAKPLPDSQKWWQIYPLPLPYDIKRTVVFLSLLPCFGGGRHVLLLFVFPETPAGFIWSELSNVPKPWTQKQLLLPATRLTTQKAAWRRGKTEDLKVRQAWVCHPIIICPWVFFLTYFTELWRFNEIINE